MLATGGHAWIFPDYGLQSLLASLLATKETTVARLAQHVSLRKGFKPQ